MRRVAPTHPRLPLLPTFVDVRNHNVPPRNGNGTDSARSLSSRADFEAFAVRDDVPGTLGIREMKFVITDAETSTPSLYLMNSNIHTLHFNFARDFLRVGLSPAEFNKVTYFTDNRRFIVGSVLAFDNYERPNGEPGLYALQFWPTDPIKVDFVDICYRMLIDAMPFAADRLAYHPSGDLQEHLFTREADIYAALNIRTVATAEIFEGTVYNPLNLGEAVGELRIISGSDRRPPGPSDIVIYDRLPNDLPLVAGVLTSTPQTSLSHVNLRARQNGIPNAFLQNAETGAPLEHYIGKTVWLAVTPDGLRIREATAQDVIDAQIERRPSHETAPPRDLTPTDIRALDDLSLSDADAYGGKATGVAELRKAIDPQYVPNGFAVPFSFYHTFMETNGLYDQAALMVASDEFRGDTLARKDMLKAFRKAIKAAGIPETLRQHLDAMHRAFPAQTTLRCRSSANAEDTIGFTGAGLYDSYTHRLDEGHIEKSIKQVWASLWNFRAFEERAFYRIDHFSSAMGVLVHPNFDGEQVNGVAITRNLYFENFDGYYVNAQVGENLITNPDGHETAEELLIMDDLNGTTHRPYEVIYVRRSSLVGQNERVIQPDDLVLLADQMELIQTHFEQLYGRASDPKFAMDIEFKFDRNGHLAIKQARPWLG